MTERNYVIDEKDAFNKMLEMMKQAKLKYSPEYLRSGAGRAYVASGVLFYVAGVVEHDMPEASKIICEGLGVDFNR